MYNVVQQVVLRLFCRPLEIGVVVYSVPFSLDAKPCLSRLGDCHQMAFCNVVLVMMMMTITVVLAVDILAKEGTILRRWTEDSRWNSSGLVRSLVLVVVSRKMIVFMSLPSVSITGFRYNDIWLLGLCLRPNTLAVPTLVLLPLVRVVWVED
jgi:hypothetical protein